MKWFSPDLSDSIYPSGGVLPTDLQPFIWLHHYFPRQTDTSQNLHSILKYILVCCFCEVWNEGMVLVLDLSWGRNLSFVSISRLGRHAQPPCTTCKSLRLNLYNCHSQVDCAFHLHLVLRLAQFVLIILGHIVLRLVLVCLCAYVLVCLCACVSNLAKSTRLASWKALKKPSSGPMHEHWAPKEVSLGFNFEFCKCKWWTSNKAFMMIIMWIHTR